MLEYGMIDTSEGIDVNKTDGLHKCIIYCHCTYFLERNVKFQPEVSNGCDDLMHKAMSFNKVAFFLLKGMITEFIFGI